MEYFLLVFVVIFRSSRSHRMRKTFDISGSDRPTVVYIIHFVFQVASVVGRAELLCATFFLLSFKCFLVYLSDNDRERNGGNFFNGAALWRCIIYSTLSILSKEQGITSLVITTTAFERRI